MLPSMEVSYMDMEEHIIFKSSSRLVQVTIHKNCSLHLHIWAWVAQGMHACMYMHLLNIEHMLVLKARHLSGSAFCWDWACPSRQWDGNPLGLGIGSRR